MSSITSTGLGSGLDINSIVTQLVAAEQTPQTKQMDAKEAKLQAQISALGSIKSAMSDFQSSLTALRYASQINKITATSSDTSTLTATAFMNADPANYQIEVKQLALSHSLASQAFASTSTVVGTGNLSIQFGTTTYDVSGNPTAFSQNTQKTPLTISIDSNHQTLTGVRDAINAANGGITASIINDGTGNRLVLKSTDGGAANSMQITADPGLSSLSYTAASHPMSDTQHAQDALLTVNGVSVSSTSNTITTALKGLTLNLQQAQPGKLINLSVGQDNTNTVKSIQAFVDKYNAFATSVISVSGYDTQTKTSGVLQGEATARGALSSVRNLLSSAVTGLSGSVRSLPDIGITTQADGTLKLDTTALNTALSADHNGVVGLFAVNGTSSNSNVIYGGSTTDTLAGSYAVQVTTAAQQALITGSAAPTTLVDATNNSFQIKIDGVTSGTINITSGNYNATPSQLAAELQTKINADATLKASGASVSVAYDSVSGKFTMTSQSYGSASQVQLMSIAGGGADIAGFTAGQLNTGVDIAGTIGGLSATGSGQTLTANSGVANGLSLQITDSVVGSHGTIEFSRGLIEQLNKVASGFLTTTTGALDTKLTGLQSRITDIETQRTKLAAKMAALQQRLFTQFNAMDQLVGSLQSTASFLTQQFSTGSSLKTK
ncbi:MAG TPA: flagellar filament capping protein FliD [Methylobacter sp.]|jgi:flagellar hook-associated protein 2